MSRRLMLLAVLLLAGCGAEDNTDFDLLTQTGSYDRVNQVLSSAEHRLVAECMTGRGLRYLPQTQAPPTPDASLAGRRAHGYGLDEPSTALPDNDAYVQTLPDAEQFDYQRALEGTDEERRAIRLSNGGTVSFAGGGCQAEAQRELYGDVIEWARITYVPQALHLKMADQVKADSGYRKAIDDWAKCMAGRGFAATSPEAVQDELKNLYATQGPSAQLREKEIATAVADGECAEQLRIPELVQDIKKRLVDELPEIDRQDLHRVAQAWTTAAANAEKP